MICTDACVVATSPGCRASSGPVCPATVVCTTAGTTPVLETTRVTLNGSRPATFGASSSAASTGSATSGVTWTSALEALAVSVSGKVASALAV